MITHTDDNQVYLSLEDLGFLAQIVSLCGHGGLVSTNYFRSSWG